MSRNERFEDIHGPADAILAPNLATKRLSPLAHLGIRRRLDERGG